GDVMSLIAGHGRVVDGQGHVSTSRSGSGSRVRAGRVSRSSARDGSWPGRQSRSWSTTITYSGRWGQLLLPGAEDADVGGIRDADAVTRKGPAAGVTAGLWW